MISSRSVFNAGVKQVLRLSAPMGYTPFTTSRLTATQNGSPVAPIDIRELARMAQIQVTDQEVADWAPKINSIVDWFGQLQAVDVSGVEPAVHAHDEGNVLRPDEPHVYINRAAVMSQVPEQQAGFVRVPKITTGADTPTNSTATSTADTLSSSSSLSSSDIDSTSSSSSSAGGVDVGGAISDQEQVALEALDIRVGRIVSCERHPDAESLYVEKVDVGEAEPRTIVSGLVKYIPLEDMQQRPVIVLCNLKPRNMRGIKSFGMLLAASDDSHENVEPLAPAAGAAPGSRVWFGQRQEQANAMEPNPLQKKKLWEGVQPVLRTNDSRAANFKGALMQTTEGPVTAASLAGARIG